MLKLIEVIGRRADLTHEYFLKHLSTTHLEVVDRVPEFRNRVRRYMQNHLFVDPAELGPIKGLPIASNTDSIIEVWWDSFADIRRAFEEPRYFEIIRPDELAFGDVAGAWGVTAQDTLVTERNGFAGLMKVFIFLKRSPGISHSEFLSRWRAARDSRLIAAPAFRSLVGRCIENVVAQDPANALPGARPFDLVAELWLDSLQHVAQFAADPDVIAAIAGAQTDYTDRAQSLIYVGKENPAAAEWLRGSQAGR
ncbi:MAG: hypothetical protein DMD33_19240 [Gemmatimonadetes bacterium]|nr:MAG: hypothetical protein DMD33_19240 [Gemmatimonadota bacterium]